MAIHGRLSALELDILRKLHEGEEVALSSLHRVRLEYAGVIREGADGIALTAEGRRLALQNASGVEPEADGDEVPLPRLDPRGRRLPFQRRSIF